MDKKKFFLSLKDTLERQIEESQAKAWAEERSKGERLKALESQAKAQSTASSIPHLGTEWMAMPQTGYTLAEMEQELHKAAAEKWWEEGAQYWSERLKLASRRAKRERWPAGKAIQLPSPPPERPKAAPTLGGVAVKAFAGYEPLREPEEIRLELANRMPKEVFQAMEAHLPASEWEKLEAMWQTVIKNFDPESQAGFFQELERQIRLQYLGGPS